MTTQFLSGSKGYIEEKEAIARLKGHQSTPPSKCRKMAEWRL